MKSSHKKIIIIGSIICILLIASSVFFITKHYYDKIEEIEKEKSSKKKKDNSNEKEDEKNPTDIITKNEETQEYIVEMPDVKGLDKEAALETIIKSFANQLDDRASSYTFNFSYDHATMGLPAGQVAKTEPSIGSQIKVKDNSEIKIVIYIDNGSPEVTIENFVGKNYLEVKGMLEAYGINVYVEKKTINNSNAYEEWTIIEQSVPAGEKLKSKDEITLYIPNVEVKYPDFTDSESNFTEVDVRKFCELHNIKLTVKYEENSSLAEGTIIKQSKPKDSPVSPGTEFTITVAKAPSEEN